MLLLRPRQHVVAVGPLRMRASVEVLPLLARAGIMDSQPDNWAGGIFDEGRHAPGLFLEQNLAPVKPQVIRVAGEHFGQGKVPRHEGQARLVLAALRGDLLDLRCGQLCPRGPAAVAGARAEQRAAVAEPRLEATAQGQGRRGSGPRPANLPRKPRRELESDRVHLLLRSVGHLQAVNHSSEQALASVVIGVFQAGLVPEASPYRAGPPTVSTLRGDRLEVAELPRVSVHTDTHRRQKVTLGDGQALRGQAMGFAV
mmetsp:Transcript_21514/g.61509  ORF Transcript_21514/g.61509 Transcript_21514/m.61509 type:complete len:256 (+) Transcript_21514:247-1014(+)